MRCARSATVAAGLAGALLTPATARTQGFPERDRIQLAVGLASTTVLDEAASPVRYGGVAPALALTWAREATASRFSLRVGVEGGTLTSALTQGDRPREQQTAGWLVVLYARRLGERGAATRWWLGARLAASGALRRHYSAGLAPGEASYGFGAVALAPWVAVERRLRSGRVEVSAAVSVLALVARPYSDLRVLSRVPLRVVTPPAFTSASVALAYTQPVSARTALVWEYQVQVQRLRDAQPFRAAAQTGSLALAIALGARS